MFFVFISSLPFACGSDAGTYYIPGLTAVCSTRPSTMRANVYQDDAVRICVDKLSVAEIYSNECVQTSQATKSVPGDTHLQ